MRQSVPASLTYENGSLVLQCEYDSGLVAALKTAVPYTERKFEKYFRGRNNVWIIAPQHQTLIASLVETYLGTRINLPSIVVTAPRVETRVLEVRYLGQTKDRSDGRRSAFGFCHGSWSVVFPEEVLREWFLAGDNRPGEATTLYGVLGVKPTAKDDEIRVAYRRLARQWHPDVCREPDAHEQFISIKNAYEILTTKRDRYDAGLKLEASVRNQPISISNSPGYRAPYRCGWVMAEGTEQLGRFTISKILGWEDIVNQAGQILVVSWPFGADIFMEVWA
jgi:hypothetical protein